SLVRPRAAKTLLNKGIQRDRTLLSASRWWPGSPSLNSEQVRFRPSPENAESLLENKNRKSQDPLSTRPARQSNDTKNQSGRTAHLYALPPTHSESCFVSGRRRRAYRRESLIQDQAQARVPDT